MAGFDKLLKVAHHIQRNMRIAHSERAQGMVWLQSPLEMLDSIICDFYTEKIEKTERTIEFQAFLK